MAKLRVRFLDSIAGLGDPNIAALDAKFNKIAAELRARDKPPTEKQIEAYIDGLKKPERYNEKPIGFRKDFAFKAGDEAMIDETLAKKWIEADICVLITEKKAA